MESWEMMGTGRMEVDASNNGSSFLPETTVRGSRIEGSVGHDPATMDNPGNPQRETSSRF